MAGSSYIGGNLADISGASTQLNSAGTAATDAGSKTSQLAAKVNQEVADVTTTLLTHFGEVANQLTAAITEAKTKLGTATWQGNARTVADGAEQSLNKNVGDTLAGATAGVEQLKQQLMTMVNGFQNDVDSQFKTVLGTINTSYGQLAKGLDTYATNLSEVDANSIKVG